MREGWRQTALLDTHLHTLGFTWYFDHVTALLIISLAGLLTLWSPKIYIPYFMDNSVHVCKSYYVLLYLSLWYVVMNHDMRNERWLLTGELFKQQLQISPFIFVSRWFHTQISQLFTVIPTSLDDFINIQWLHCSDFISKLAFNLSEPTTTVLKLDLAKDMPNLYYITDRSFDYENNIKM